MTGTDFDLEAEAADLFEKIMLHTEWENRGHLETFAALDGVSKQDAGDLAVRLEELLQASSPASVVTAHIDGNGQMLIKKHPRR